MERERLIDWLDNPEPGGTAADALQRAQRCEEEADDMAREAGRMEALGRHDYARTLMRLAGHMRGQVPMWTQIAQHRAEGEAA